MNRLASCASSIGRLIPAVRSLTPELAVLLVICVKGRTPIRSDYDGFSVATTFLSTIEIADFIDALRVNGFFVQHFVDEVDFMTWTLSGEYASLPHAHKIVYT